MNNRENSEKLIESYYQAFNQKDMKKFISLLDDNVIHDINQGQREIGKETFKKFMDAINEFYDEKLEKIIIMSNPDGSRVGAEYHVHGKYLASAPDLPPAHGQTYSLPGGAFFEIKNNKITRVTNYYNVPDWLKQVK